MSPINRHSNKAMKRRLNTLINILALIAFIITLASRLALWLSWSDMSAWSKLQMVSSMAFTLLVIIHVALHWKWFANLIRK
ncbi:MAG: DUF4405 domain-containing protein [Methanotrichaceae archaeon]